MFWQSIQSTIWMRCVAKCPRVMERWKRISKKQIICSKWIESVFKNCEISWAFSSTFIQMRIAFSSASYRTTYLIPLYTKSLFMADVGGLIALFMGASLISFIEIIFYIALNRFCWPKSPRTDVHHSKTRCFSAPENVENEIQGRKIRRHSLI